MLKHINVKQLDLIAGNDANFKKELIDIFSEQAEEFIANIRQFLKEENWEKLAKEAHTAKSSVMVFGMEETGRLLKKIQNECLANNLANIYDMTEKAVQQIKAVMPELKLLRNSL